MELCWLTGQSCLIEADYWNELPPQNVGSQYWCYGFLVTETWSWWAHSPQGLIIYAERVHVMEHDFL